MHSTSISDLVNKNIIYKNNVHLIMSYCGASTAAKKAQDVILSFKPSMHKKNV
jgi:hypothetical protein